MPKLPRLVRAAAPAGFAVAVLVVLLTPLAAATGAAVAAPAIPPLTFLHVVTPSGRAAICTPYLADAAGRQVLLHGVAAVGMEDVAYPNANGGPALFPVSPSAYDGRCPKASPLIPQPPLCEIQASKPALPAVDRTGQRRRLRPDARRSASTSSASSSTGASSSRRRASYSTTYLDRVAQVVGWARQQGIYVILDMHQDQYSRYILPADTKAAPLGVQPLGRW